MMAAEYYAFQFINQHEDLSMAAQFAAKYGEIMFKDGGNLVSRPNVIESVVWDGETYGVSQQRLG